MTRCLMKKFYKKATKAVVEVPEDQRPLWSGRQQGRGRAERCEKQEQVVREPPSPTASTTTTTTNDTITKGFQFAQDKEGLWNNTSKAVFARSTWTALPGCWTRSTEELNAQEGETAKLKAKEAQEARKKAKAHERKVTRVRIAVKRAKNAQAREEQETAHLIRITSGKLEVRQRIHPSPDTHRQPSLATFYIRSTNDDPFNRTALLAVCTSKEVIRLLKEKLRAERNKRARKEGPLEQEILKLCRVNSELNQELTAKKGDNRQLLEQLTDNNFKKPARKVNEPSVGGGGAVQSPPAVQLCSHRPHLLTYLNYYNRVKNNVYFHCGCPGHGFKQCPKFHAKLAEAAAAAKNDPRFHIVPARVPRSPRTVPPRQFPCGTGRRGQQRQEQLRKEWRRVVKEQVVMEPPSPTGSTASTSNDIDTDTGSNFDKNNFPSLPGAKDKLTTTPRDTDPRFHIVPARVPRSPRTVPPRQFPCGTGRRGQQRQEQLRKEWRRVVKEQVVMEPPSPTGSTASTSNDIDTDTGSNFDKNNFPSLPGAKDKLTTTPRDTGKWEKRSKKVMEAPTPTPTPTTTTTGKTTNKVCPHRHHVPLIVKTKDRVKDPRFYIVPAPGAATQKTTETANKKVRTHTTKVCFWCGEPGHGYLDCLDFRAKLAAAKPNPNPFWIIEAPSVTAPVLTVKTEPAKQTKKPSEKLIRLITDKATTTPVEANTVRQRPAPPPDTHRQPSLATFYIRSTDDDPFNRTALLAVCTSKEVIRLLKEKLRAERNKRAKKEGPLEQEILKLCRVNSELNQELTAKKGDNRQLLEQLTDNNFKKPARKDPRFHIVPARAPRSPRTVPPRQFPCGTGRRGQQRQEQLRKEWRRVVKEQVVMEPPSPTGSTASTSNDIDTDTGSNFDKNNFPSLPGAKDKLTTTPRDTECTHRHHVPLIVKTKDRVKNNVCFHCGQPGHFHSNCPKLAAATAAARNDPRFYIVPAPGAATQKTTETANKKVRTHTTKVCFWCGGPGHGYLDCLDFRAKLAAAKPNPNPFWIIEAPSVTAPKLTKMEPAKQTKKPSERLIRLISGKATITPVEANTNCVVGVSSSGKATTTPVEANTAVVEVPEDQAPAVMEEEIKELELRKEQKR
ncbi:unnamed protein product [Vitrella brassicaformis CCMP3155]|uniref:CCHC-type domain-containing protein n=1 Tax=Vitrella brassicaformis (strain CCMP3155) TaxID=1169540 RepID=A0A0G4EP24_VITBC|nr:unnamed protein product [Vitrella brassicaformis CCMP3155]|eukprot:CEL99560.1 unnamed protein product [Vitrella brassicaformis CCMP3155]